jgi:hypothetical protein
MSDMTDTSKEAVERWCKQRGKLLTNPPQTPPEVKMLLALLSERDALRAQLQAARDDALEEALDAVIKNAPHFGPEGPATSEEYGESEGFRIAVQTIRALKSTCNGEGQ